MNNFEEKDYKVFDMFKEQWALVSAGNIDDFNSCTVGWGSLGTLWTRPGKSGAVVTVYIHPSRYTWDFFIQNEIFTVSFFPSKYKGALGYMGSHSGRNENKAEGAGLTAVSIGESVTYEEANLTFLCRKICQQAFSKENLPTDVQDYYKSNPEVFPPDEEGEWQPHWLFIGEIIEVEDKE